MVQQVNLRVERARDATLVARAKQLLQARVKAGEPRFEEVYDGSRQRGLLRIRKRGRLTREVPLPAAENQWRRTEF